MRRLLPILLLVSCRETPPPQKIAPEIKADPGPTAVDAKVFVAKVNADLKRLWVRSSTGDWIRNTYITDDTERLAAALNDDVLAYATQAMRDARKFAGLQLDPDTARALTLLRTSSTLLSPDDAGKREGLTQLMAKLDGMYGKGKSCRPGKDGKEECRNLDQLSDVLATSRDYDVQLDAWKSWHDTAREMKPLYSRLVSIANEGAREFGYADTGELWRSGYDQPPAAFEADTERLWQQVKPLYDLLHCYVRGKLTAKYGADKVRPGAPIPAHLLGNMWAQSWENLYPMLEPFPGQASLDVTAALVKGKWDERRMVKLGESFFTSLGLNPLPPTFWDRSQFTRPRDREVVCHASAWDVQFNNDLRIKMCIKINDEDLVTIHHELGHDYYYAYYYGLPALFQQGANDGFHEAIGDAIALSVTPSYLKKAGILAEEPAKNEKATINIQLRKALEKVAFLPFGRMIDQWRWDVFAGKVKPENYNGAWWKLRRSFQGVQAPIARTEEEFDPGAKYHIPGNTPYMRYFLATIYQFQFHRALCKAAGFTGPLHECSIHGNAVAGDKLKAMLAMGASRPWPEAMEAMTGERVGDASAILEYFGPLKGWLEKETAGQQCGWSAEQATP